MSSEIVSKAMVKGYASGALIMTFFAEFWAAATLLSLTSLERVFLLTVMLALAVVLLAGSISVLRVARRIPQHSSPEAARQGKSIAWQFAVVGGIEIVVIMLASIFLGQTGHDEFIPVAIGLIVGIHFLPLAYVFQVRVYYLTGLIMSLLAGGALVALFFKITLGGPYVWAMIVGLGNAVILWLTALYILSAAKRLLHYSG